MLEILLVLFIVVSIGLLLVLNKNKRALSELGKQLKHEKEVAQQSVRNVREMLAKAEELNAKYRKDISTLQVQRSDLQSELSKLKTQKSSKSARKSKSTQKK